MKVIATKAEAAIAMRETIDLGKTDAISILPILAHKQTNTKKKNHQSPFANFNSARQTNLEDFRLKRVYDEDGAGWWVDYSDERPEEYRKTGMKPKGPYRRLKNRNKTPERPIRMRSKADPSYKERYHMPEEKLSWLRRLINKAQNK